VGQWWGKLDRDMVGQVRDKIYFRQRLKELVSYLLDKLVLFTGLNALTQVGGIRQVFRSCIFRPSYMVRHFPGLAFSGPVIFVVRHFQVLHFQRPHQADIT